MYSYYDEIKKIQYEIDKILQKMAFYKDLDELRIRLGKKYQEIKEEYSRRGNEYSLIHDLALLYFYADVISIANNLLLSKKINKPIYNEENIDKIYEYLNNLPYEDLDYDELIKLADTIKNIDSEGQLLDYYYQILYLITTIDKYNNKESTLYNMLDKETKKIMEKILLDKLLIERDEENYQKYLINGFTNTLTNSEQAFLDRFATKTIMNLDYTEIKSFSEGLALVKKSFPFEAWGYIDKSGKEVIPCQYYLASSFSNGFAKVRKYGSDGYGYINKSGKEIIPCQYIYAESFSEGLALVSKDDFYGYINKTGKEKISCQYEDARSFSEGLALVMKNGLYGYIDKTGKKVIPCKYQDAGSFSEGLALVRKNGLWYYIDKTGKKVIRNAILRKYSLISWFSNGLALVKNGKGLYGYIDKTGKEVITCQYENAKSFSEGLAVVEKDYFWYYIDKTGKEVIPCQYKDTYSFSEGFAAVNKDGKRFFIDKEGNILHNKSFKGKISDLITEMKHENHKKLIKTVDNVRINK